MNMARPYRITDRDPGKRSSAQRALGADQPRAGIQSDAGAAVAGRQIGQQIIGNGLARVTVSADFGIKDFGTGASAMCSVSLTCNQDVTTIERAAKIAGDLARDLAQEQRQNAENELQGIIAGRTQGGRPPYAG